MRIPENVVQEILNRSRIEDVVGEYVQLNRRGDRLWGLSPFKTEKTPSFTVSPDKGLYYCFSTQKGGSVVNFIMEMERLSYPEALSFLAKKLGIDVTDEDGELSDDYRRKKSLNDLYQRLTQTFHHLLTKADQGKPALEYLTNRGLSLDIIDQFQLGYSPDDPFWLYNFLSEKKYSREFLAASGLFGGKNKDWCIFHGRAMFPICDLSGETIAFGGRVLSGNGPKYINSPETPIYHKGATLYALHLARDSIKASGNAILCEGYMDAIALHSAGLTNAVAPLGTAFTPGQANLLKRFAPDVTLLFDGDDAGVRATLKTLVIAEQNELNSFIIEMPGGKKDPADILKENGSHELKKIIDYRINAFEYLLRRSSRSVSFQSPEGKEKVVQSFFPYLSGIQSPVKLDASLSMLSDVIGIAKETLRDEMHRRLKRTPENAPVPVSKQAKLVPKKDAIGSHSVLDLRIMLAVFVQSELFSFVRSAIELEDLSHPWAQELFVILEDSLRNGSRDFDERVTQITDFELRNIVQQKAIDGEFSVNPRIFVTDGVRRIRERNLTRRRDRINFELRRLLYDPAHDQAQEHELLTEIVVLEQALKDLRKNIDDRTAE